MARFEPGDPDFEAKVRSGFSRQTDMQAFGGVMGTVPMPSGPCPYVRMTLSPMVDIPPRVAGWPTIPSMTVSNMN